MVWKLCTIFLIGKFQNILGLHGKGLRLVKFFGGIFAETKTLKLLEFSFSLEMRRVKGRSQPALCYIAEENRAVIPSGITFIKHLNGI